MGNYNQHLLCQASIKKIEENKILKRKGEGICRLMYFAEVEYSNMVVDSN